VGFTESSLTVRLLAASLLPARSLEQYSQVEVPWVLTRNGAA